MIRGMILDSYDWFVGIVDERRPLTRAEAMRSPTARSSPAARRSHKLVDGLGGEREAIAWLAAKASIRT